MKVAFRFNLLDMVSGNIDAFTVSAEASGRDHGEQTMRQLLKYSGTISEAMGNAVARGRRFGWPVMLEVLEGIEIDFDDNGEPELPSMISDRDISKVVPYPPLTDADRPAYEALIAEVIRRHPGCAHPISDRWAVSLVPPALVLLRAGSKERLSEHLIAVTYREELTEDLFDTAPHYARQLQDRYLQQVERPWDLLAVSAFLRDRHFLSAIHSMGTPPESRITRHR